MHLLPTARLDVFHHGVERLQRLGDRLRWLMGTMRRARASL